MKLLSKDIDTVTTHKKIIEPLNGIKTEAFKHYYHVINNTAIKYGKGQFSTLTASMHA